MNVRSDHLEPPNFSELTLTIDLCQGFFVISKNRVYYLLGTYVYNRFHELCLELLTLIIACNFSVYYVYFNSETATSDCTSTPNTCGNWCDMRCSSTISPRRTCGRRASLTTVGQYSWKLFATAESNQINRAKLNGNANCRKATVSELNVLLESPRLINEVCVNDSSGNAMKKKTVS